MKFENFNITLFRGFFGNDTYDAVKEQDFVFRVTTDAVKDLNNFKQAFTYQHEDVMGNIRTIVEFNLHAVTAAAKVCGAVTEEDIKVHRLGVLVHELVHVKQLAEKRLTGGFRCVKWDDKEFPAETKVITSICYSLGSEKLTLLVIRLCTTCQKNMPPNCLNVWFIMPVHSV